jgi:hypothetical protein
MEDLLLALPTTDTIVEMMHFLTQTLRRHLIMSLLWD